MSWFSKTFDRIEMSSIYSQHLTTFYHYEKKKFYNKTEIPFSDKLVFLGLPLLLSIIMCALGLAFNTDYVNITLTSLSIFTGLLFSLLAMVLGLIQENQKINLDLVKPEDFRKVTARIDLTNHLFINIGFTIALSILAIVAVLLTQFHPNKLIELINQCKHYSVFKMVISYILNGIAFFLIIEFLLTLLMIVKRFTVLFLESH